MENEMPSFSFVIEYAGKFVTCNVSMQSDSYNVFFDGRLMASIAHTYEFTWIQASGVILPKSTIDEIGLRIESEYK